MAETCIGCHICGHRFFRNIRNIVLLISVFCVHSIVIEMEKKETYEYVSIEITEEEIARQLDECPGGRKAGRGDSPYTQEFYEEFWGIRKEEE